MNMHFFFYIMDTFHFVFVEKLHTARRTHILWGVNFSAAYYLTGELHVRICLDESCQINL